MAVRIAMLAALAVSAQAGYLRDLKEEAAPKNRVVKTFQFPATLLVSGRHPAWLVDLASTLAVPEARCCPRVREREREKEPRHPSRCACWLQVGKGGMNPFLSAANWSNIAGKEWKVCKDTTTARQGDKYGLGCSDAPGFGSGITWNPCGEKVLPLQRHDFAARDASARVC
jgi:hypothetical protein